MAPRNKASRQHVTRPRRWWQHPVAKWLGISVATPVLVSVLAWALQQPFAPTASSGSGTTNPTPTSTSVTPPRSAPTSPLSASPMPTESGPPVSVDLVRVERHEVQGDTFVAREAIQLSKKQLADLNSLPTSSTARAEWLWAHGAVDPVDSYIKLVLRGNRKHKVRIIAMRANTACEPPLKGTIFFSPQGAKICSPRCFSTLMSRSLRLG